MKLKPKKCLFLRDEVPYLGHVVTREGIQPDPSKTERIREYPVPTSVSQVRQFLGLASYYRRFICGFSTIATLLNALLRKDVAFRWDDSCQEAFEQLKQCLVSAPVLAYPQFKPELPFVLETDASLLGLGAVLAQKQADGNVHLIAYVSRSINSHERNYSVTELETLGLVWAAWLFRPYLLGRKCIVHTDHSACTSLLNGSNPSDKLARWAMIIQELDLEIKHRSGKSNANADALSRNPPANHVLQVTTAADDGPVENELSLKQRQDPEFLAMFQYIEDGVLPDNDKQAKQIMLEFAIVEGVLYYEKTDVPGALRIAVPKCMRQTVLEEAHSKNFSGHFA